jgi:hypothetical protein
LEARDLLLGEGDVFPALLHEQVDLQRNRQKEEQRDADQARTDRKSTEHGFIPRKAVFPGVN